MYKNLYRLVKCINRLYIQLLIANVAVLMHGCAYKRRRYHGSQLPTAGEGDSDDHCLPVSLAYQCVLDL